MGSFAVALESEIHHNKFSTLEQTEIVLTFLKPARFLKPGRFRT